MYGQYVFIYVCLYRPMCHVFVLMVGVDVFRAWCRSRDRGLLSDPGELCSWYLHPQLGSGICGQDGRQAQVLNLVFDLEANG